MEELISDIDRVIEAITNGEIEDAVKLLEEIKSTSK